MDYQTEEKLAVRTSLSVEEHARVRLVQLQHTAENSLVYNQIEGECEKRPYRAGTDLSRKGDIYSDTTINLNGDASTFRSDIGYIGQHTHIIDMNEVVNHYGNIQRVKSTWAVPCATVQRRSSVERLILRLALPIPSETSWKMY